MQRSLVAATLAAAVVLGMAGSALATHVFRDVRDASTHADAIHWAHANGIIEGFDDGTFRPRETILRDQAASLLLRYDEHVDRKIAEALPGAIAPLPPFGQAGIILDPGGRHVPKPVYVADRDDLRQQGLMHVEHLPREAGMLFVWGQSRTGGFFMRNTLIPLSIAFFDADGVVLAILDMVPCDADPCEIYDPGVAYRGALEVNAGRFDDLGLGEPGWRIDVPEHVWPAPPGS